MSPPTAGALDPDFADRGRLILGSGFFDSQLRKVYALDSGGLLGVGSVQLNGESTHRFAAARVTDSGVLDRSFAESGYLLGEPAQVSVHRFSGLAASGEGDLFLVGNFADKARDVLLRYTAGGECLHRWQLTPPTARSNATHPMIAAQPGGRMWVCSSSMSSGVCEGVVYRRLSDGEVDERFAENGVLHVRVDNTYVRFNDLTIATGHGYLVVAADVHRWTGEDSEVSLFCFDRNSGNTVMEFGVNGRFIYPAAKSLYRLLSIQRVVSSGYGLLAVIQAYDTEGMIYSLFIRVTEDGGIDSSFNGGRPIVLAGAYSDVAVQSDGRVIVMASNLYPDTIVRRYRVNGELDRGFGNGGEVLLGQPGERLYGLAVQHDDRIVVSAVGRGSVLYRLQG